MKNLSHYRPQIELAILILIVVTLALSGYVAYQYRLISRDLDAATSASDLLTDQLDLTRIEKRSLEELAANQRYVIESFERQIKSLGSTVGTLEKLAQTDPELLKKYSKVYFLNENYVPTKLTEIDKFYVLEGSTNFLIHADVWPHLEALLKNARSNNLDLVVASAFRSFDTQASLKSEYKVIYGAGTANQFSADQGYSEHQLGTSVDFTSTKIGVVTSSFADDPAYQWLRDHAYRFGFVLSYPENNAYYKFEPWHWRYVGIDLAGKLHSEGKYFYELDQREIDTYLVKLFD